MQESDEAISQNKLALSVRDCFGKLSSKSYRCFPRNDVTSKIAHGLVKCIRAEYLNFISQKTFWNLLPIVLLLAQA